MSVIVYEILTQLIIWLGLLRTRLCSRSLTMQRRHQRTFFASNCEVAECCDCGLVHVHYPLFGEDVREKHFRMVPVRPKGYAYRARVGCAPSSASVDLSNVDLNHHEQATVHFFGCHRFQRAGFRLFACSFFVAQPLHA